MREKIRAVLDQLGVCGKAADPRVEKLLHEACSKVSEAYKLLPPGQRVRVEVSGIVAGFAYGDESLEEATARLVLEAEMAANKDGNVRLHLNAAKT